MNLFLTILLLIIFVSLALMYDQITTRLNGILTLEEWILVTIVFIVVELFIFYLLTLHLLPPHTQP